MFSECAGHASCFFFFFNDTATTEIYTLSLHDALPICSGFRARPPRADVASGAGGRRVKIAFVVQRYGTEDRKSTRLNSSHSQISYAVFCLKKKNKPTINGTPQRRLIHKLAHIRCHTQI